MNQAHAHKPDVDNDNGDIDCAICLQQITSKTVSAWSCKHMFHENCALNWKTTQCNATCPCCRALQRNSTSKFTCCRALQRNSTSKFTFQIGISWGHQITISKYPWEKKNCIKKKCNEHIITYSKPHGVLGTCTCGEIQSYNWKM